MDKKPKIHQNPTLTTTDGDPDLSGVQPGDHVISHVTWGANGRQRQRDSWLPANTVLTADRQPVVEAPDGATPMLGGGQLVKLGGEILAQTEPSAPPSVEALPQPNNPPSQLPPSPES